MDDQVVFALSKLIKKMTELTENIRETKKLIKLLWEVKSNGKREDC